MEDLRTTICFKTEVLVGDNGDVVNFEIQVDRYQDTFKIVLGDEVIGYGDYKGNLIDLLKSILLVEQSFLAAEARDEMMAQLQETLPKPN